MEILSNEEIYNIAYAQSALDCNCKAEDFSAKENIVVLSQKNPKARVYLELPFFCNIVSYGKNVVATVSPEIEEFIREYINRDAHTCFETPIIHLLTKEFETFGKTLCFMAEYFLPDITAMKELPCEYEMRILEKGEFDDLYKNEWSNAVSKKRRELDMLVAVAYDNQKVIGVAGASADCETMWQIGIDVLPEYRNRGIASALTSKISLEVFKRAKVPFYCAAWSNIASVKNAIKSGFRPAWVELTAIDKDKALSYK